MPDATEPADPLPPTEASGSAGSGRLASTPDLRRGAGLWRAAIRGWLDPQTARALAAHPQSPPLLLRLLARRRWDVAAAVAGNSGCPRGLRGWLASSPRWAVQAAVAASPHTPAELLSSLVSDSAGRVRLYVAANRSAPGPVIDRLLADRNPYVRAVAAAHPAASPAALEELAAGLTQPAFVLRAAGANPACPDGLSEQILTWLALGGAGSADPLFDPVECTGHPGDTTITAQAWYFEQASSGLAETSALWRLRAVTIPATRRITIGARELTRDPRPEVRRVAARFINMPAGLLRELQQDGDPQTAQAAAASLTAATRSPHLRRQRLRGRLWLLGPLISVAGLIGTVTTSQTSASRPPVHPSALASGVRTYTVYGGATVTCAQLRSSGEGRQFLVSFTNGSIAVDLRIPEARVWPGGLPASQPVHVAANAHREFTVPASSGTVTVTVAGAGGTSQPEPLNGCGQ